MGIEDLFSREIFPLFIERVLFLLAVTIPFDLRDISNDQRAGLSTIATQFGFQKGRQVGLLVAVLWFIQTGYVSLMGNSIEVAVIYLGIFSLIIMGYILMKQSWEELKYTLVFEGLILTYALAFILLSRFHSMA